jgi:hypothetical protein
MAKDARGDEENGGSVMKLSGTSIGSSHKPVIVNGKVKLVADLKTAEAKLDVSTRIKRKHSPKVKFKRGGK